MIAKPKEVHMHSEHGSVRQVMVSGRLADEIILDNLVRVRANYLEYGLTGDAKTIAEQIEIVTERLKANNYKSVNKL